MASKRFKQITFIFSLIILIILIYSIINFGVLKNQINENLNNKIQKYGYITIFIVGFLGEIIPQPFVSAIIPFTNGLLLNLNHKILLTILLTSTILSSLLGYVLGHVYGKGIILKFIEEENYHKYKKLFKKYGKLGMTIAAFTPLPYLPIIPGLFKMKFKDFIIYGLIPRLIYFTGFALVLIVLL